MDLLLIERYKKLFGIKIPINKFPAKELKRRYRILALKYHPDKGGKPEHFRFVMDAHNYLKNFCSEEEEKEEVILKNFFGIKEIRIKVGNGYGYIWDIEDERKGANYYV